MISNTLSSIITNLSNAYDALSSKGATIPASKNIENLASAIGTIQTGGGGSDSSPEILMGTISQYIDTEGKVTYIRDYAFTFCKSLLNASFPNCISVGGSAFADCSNLSNINLPNCFIFSAGSVFFDCRNLTSITLNNLVTVLGSQHFNNCYNLSYISIPYLTGSISTIFQRIPLEELNLGYIAGIGINQTPFSSISGTLSVLSLPYISNMGNINNWAALKQIFIPNGKLIAVTTCPNLEEITFCGSSSIAAYAFSNTKLQSFYLLNGSSTKVTPLSNVNAFANTPIADDTILGYYGSVYVPSSLVSMYQSATNWITYSDRITALPSEYDSKYIYAYELTGQTFSEIPSNKINAEYILSWGFYNAGSTISTTMNFPSCKVIGFSAFSACQFRNYDFPVCEAVLDYAFFNTNMSTINLPNCKFIGSSAFKSCKRLTTINLSNCEIICGAAFTDCYSIESINLSTVKFIQNNALMSCTKISGYLNLENCLSLGYGALAQCKSINTIYLPKCRLIGGNVFSGCSKLSQLIVGTQLSIPCIISDQSTFYETPMVNSTYLGYYGSIYVPDSLVSAYQSANWWSSVSARITGVSNLPSV